MHQLALGASPCDCIRHKSCYIYYLQNWSYPRSDLTYMRELGEGQFGKVLLMKATVSQQDFMANSVLLNSFLLGHSWLHG